jgi:hypothetical protein
MYTQFNGLLWFILMLVPLVFLQRLLHREIQAVILITTRNPGLTIGLFSILFFPTGGFSVIPHSTPEGRLQLGFVETVKTDPVRDSLIGVAPLIVGSLVVAYAAINRLHLQTLWDVLRTGQFELFWLGLGVLPQVQDFPVWFYLAFTVSSTTAE